MNLEYLENLNIQVGLLEGTKCQENVSGRKTYLSLLCKCKGKI